jgi:hypothetical protein
MRCKEKRDFSKEELMTFGFNELCALYANSGKWFVTEGRSKGPNGKLYSGIKRKVNAEFKRRRKLCQEREAEIKACSTKETQQISLSL